MSKQLHRSLVAGWGQPQILEDKKKKVLYSPFHSPNPSDQSQPLMGPFMHEESY